MSARARYGRGLKFPLAPQGSFAMVEGAEAVDQALRTLLMTQPGERVRRPQWGCRLRSYLFEPNSVATRTLLRREVIEAISRFEPRVRLDEVRVTTDESEPTRIVIDIGYRLVDDPTARTLVFPFYLRGESPSSGEVRR